MTFNFTANDSQTAKARYEALAPDLIKINGDVDEKKKKVNMIRA